MVNSSLYLDHNGPVSFNIFLSMWQLVSFSSWSRFLSCSHRDRKTDWKMETRLFNSPCSYLLLVCINVLLRLLIPLSSLLHCSLFCLEWTQEGGVFWLQTTTLQVWRRGGVRWWGGKRRGGRGERGKVRKWGKEGEREEREGGRERGKREGEGREKRRKVYMMWESWDSLKNDCCMLKQQIHTHTPSHLSRLHLP